MKFLSAFLAALAAAAVLYARLVRLVDPHGDFGSGRFPVVSMDARAEKMRLFSAYPPEGIPEGLILGSSRAMKISPRTLQAATGHRFFNFAVDNARAEDYLAIYRWVRHRQARIEFLLVGLDVEALHNDDRPEPDLLRNDALVRTLEPGMLSEPGLGTPFRANRVARLVKEYKSTFTIEYLTDVLRALRLSVRPRSRPLPLMEFEPDGYLRYPRWEEQRAAGTFRFDQDLERCLSKYYARFDRMTGLSARRRAFLEELVAEARGEGARVVLWITDLHPLTARYLEAHTGYAGLLEATRAYERALNAREGVAAYDFSRPESYAGTAGGWYDCAHIDETNADRMAAALLPPLH